MKIVVAFILKIVVAFILLSPLAFAGDLETIKSEPKPEKRARAAMDYAFESLKFARKSYAEGDLKATSAFVTQIGDSVELAGNSLGETGKKPRKNPKHFKQTEIKTRELLRKLESFRDEMSDGDRGIVDLVRTRLERAQEGLLAGIMGQE